MGVVAAADERSQVSLVSGIHELVVSGVSKV